MKRYIMKALAVILVAMLLCASAMAEVRTTGNVYMRTGPGLSYDTITSYPEGSTLSYLGETSVDERGVAWYKVSDGSHSGWMSSRYSQLIGESSSSSSSSQNSGSQSSGQAFPSANELIPATPSDQSGNWFSDIPGEVELSNYYLVNLSIAAQAIGLTDFRVDGTSEAPNQYYNDSVVVAGDNLVVHFVVTGKGYSVFGVTVGMDMSDATDQLITSGLVYRHGTFEHRASDFSQANVDGYDSCINLTYDSNNVITEIDWSSYTG